MNFPGPRVERPALHSFLKKDEKKLEKLFELCYRYIYHKDVSAIA